MKYTLFSLALLSACHGFAMQQPTLPPAPASAATSATPLLQKSQAHSPNTSASILVALMHGTAPLDTFKQMIKTRLLGS